MRLLKTKPPVWIGDDDEDDDDEYHIIKHYTRWIHSIQSVGSRLDLHDSQSGGRAAGSFEWPISFSHDPTEKLLLRWKLKKEPGKYMRISKLHS